MPVVFDHHSVFSLDHSFGLSDIGIKAFLQDLDDLLNGEEIVIGKLLLGICDFFEEIGILIDKTLEEEEVWSLVQLIVLDYRRQWKTVISST